MAIRKRLNKDGSISYQVKVKHPSRDWITKTFRKKKDAEIFETKTRVSLYEDSLPSFYIKKITVQEFWGEWSVKSRSKASDGWKLSQNQMYRDYIEPSIGCRLIQTITGADIANILSKMKDSRSEQTRAHVYNLLNKLFGDAHEEYEYIHRNPVKKSHKPTVPQMDSRYLNLSEIKALLNYTKNKHYGLAIWIQLYCGLRVGEVQVLRWEDVDFNQRTLSVKSTYCRKTFKIQDYPKGRKWHNVPIPSELYEYLKDSFNKNKSSPYVIEPTSEKGIMSYHGFYKVLKRYFRELKIDNASPHTLRHSTSQIYFNQGASIEDLQFLLAHSSASTTNRYAHNNHFKSKSVTEVANNILLLDGFN